MSRQAAEEPASKAPPACKALDAVIVPPPRDLGGFEVRRFPPVSGDAEFIAPPE